MTRSMFEITGDTAVVTGASRGIGKAIAERFATEGVEVVICSRELDNVTPVANQINESDAPGQAIPVECDVTEWNDIEQLVDASASEFGGIDILVNNAGVSFRAPFEELSENAWNTVVDTDLNGVFNCSRVIGEQMRESGGGTIINISSVAGRDGAPEMTHYAAAKAGLNRLTWTLAYEWSRYGIRVNGVAPGLIATEGLQQQLGIQVDDIDKDETDRQIGLPDEIAVVVQFLASKAARYVQGQTICVEGVPRLAHSRHHETETYVRGTE